MKIKASIIINIFIGIMSYASWIFMALLSKSTDALTSNNFESLKYFTVLSNLLNGLISFIYVFFLLKKRKNSIINLLKLIGVTSVGLTFTTVVVFLGPIYGYKMMFSGVNLWLHLILPILSFVSFIFFEESNLKFKETLYTIIPTIIYGTLYLTNVIINGIGEWPNGNDFYSFFAWGNLVGAFIFIIIILVTWSISLLMLKFNKLVNKK